MINYHNNNNSQKVIYLLFLFLSLHSCFNEDNTSNLNKFLQPQQQQQQQQQQLRKSHVGLGVNFIIPTRLSSTERSYDLERKELFETDQSYRKIMKVSCEDGGELATLGNIDESALRAFVLHHSNKTGGCQCQSPCVVRTSEIEWNEETLQYFAELWSAGRLLRPIDSPGVPKINKHQSPRPQPQQQQQQSQIQDFEKRPLLYSKSKDLEEMINSHYIQNELISASHSLKQVFGSISQSKSDKTVTKLMKTALGDDVFRLNHPSREAAQEVLNRIKSNFMFFHGTECPQKEVNGVACGRAVPQGSTACDSEEVHHMCSYVELYRCEACSHSFRFGRFRSVPKLLETKMGRCGEFSDVAVSAFTMLGYDSRLVVDYTDHVWVEIKLENKQDSSPHFKQILKLNSDDDVKAFSQFLLSNENSTKLEQRLQQQTSYVHADPSEGVLDNPFLYEDNWKKQLTFVFAHKVDSVEDRSKIYSHVEKHGELVDRRGVDDADLEAEVISANRMLKNEKTASKDVDQPEIKLREIVVSELEENVNGNTVTQSSEQK